jgi:hypothetical protein
MKWPITPISGGGCSKPLRRILSAWLVIGLLSSGLSAQTPPASPGQRFGFDYRTSDLTTFQVARFELQIDGGAWVSVGMPPSAPQPDTPADFTTLGVPIPALTPGQHTASLRACNSVCGEGSVPFTFLMVVEPPAPGQGRIIGGV